MEEIIRKILDSACFAVVGSFRNKSKYAYRILLDLKSRNKKVYPVNPRGGKVEGIKCYKSIKDIPEDVEAVSIVTPPAVTEKIVMECKKKDIVHVWMQPGAESRKAIEYCKKNNMNSVSHACLLLNR